MPKIWEWILVENNRKLLAFLGSAIAAILIAFWTVFTYFDQNTKPDKKDSDTLFEKKIVGTWKSEINYLEEGAGYDIESTFLANGKLKSNGDFTLEGEIKNIIWEGNWNVSDGFLNTIITVSNTPYVMPEGASSTNRIISVNKDELKLFDTHSESLIVLSRIKSNK